MAVNNPQHGAVTVPENPARFGPVPVVKADRLFPIGTGRREVRASLDATRQVVNALRDDVAHHRELIDRLLEELRKAGLVK